MNTKIIKQKMKSVGSIKKITRTMEMVSVAKMRKAIIESTLLKPFALEIKKTLDELGPQLAESNYVKANNAIDKILIIVASNKGLCGAYNSNVYKFSNKLNDEEKFTKAICYGKFAEKIAKN
jgi:F0F1-type ATP synthase, gamma subunit